MIERFPNIDKEILAKKGLNIIDACQIFPTFYCRESTGYQMLKRQPAF